MDRSFAVGCATVGAKTNDDRHPSAGHSQMILELWAGQLIILQNYLAAKPSGWLLFFPVPPMPFHHHGRMQPSLRYSPLFRAQVNSLVVYEYLD
jgi:hypothetical protein